MGSCQNINMKLLNFFFLAVINGNQLTTQNVDSLLKNGIRGTQCGNPHIGSRKRRSLLSRSQRYFGYERRGEDWSEHDMIIAMHKGIFESCTSNSFTIEKNGALPPITVGGFYLPNYGAGKAGPQAFDPNKNYMGVVIMAVHANGQWYNDHSKTFFTRNINPVDKRTYTARIKPGYILMNEAEYLEKNHKGGSMHSKLLRDFTGKDQATLQKEGIYYVGWGFSYQKKDSKTGSLFCDFKDNSSTFNGNVINIPKIGQIPVLMNPNTKSNRDTGVNNLIKFAINHWRITKSRVTKASDIVRYMNANAEVKKQLPTCP